MLPQLHAPPLPLLLLVLMLLLPCKLDQVCQPANTQYRAFSLVNEQGFNEAALCSGMVRATVAHMLVRGKIDMGGNTYTYDAACARVRACVCACVYAYMRKSK